MINIGILRETKIPADNRVVLSPEQIAKLEKEYPQLRFFVQSSKERIFSDEEYREAGVEVVGELSNCQYLFGVKEANIECLLNNKHYFFFGHIAKMQQYNKPLLQSMVDKEITFTDYEYLTDDQGKRVCAFGWWAGVVGIYNTLRLYGLKYKCFKLPPLDRCSSVESMKAELCSIVPIIKNRRVRILVTGKGRCSQGVQDVLDSMGIIAANVEQYLTSRNRPCYCVASLDNLVSRYDGKSFKRFDFKESPHCYRSDFDKYIPCTDILITAHSWQPNQPVYVSKETIANPLNRIKVIGDITCDIDGSIKTTIRPTSHIAPYYDIDVSLHEVDLFSDTDNISVMAVDNLPNALAHEASKYFGERLCQYVFPALFGKQKNTKEIRRATILNEGRLTEPYIYLNSLLNSSE